ncbi:MAG: sigma-70 family RNA polymerase sigma factor [Gemmatimonadaceae bacterium]|nr:sigma-70 family RNA polymerase sigma factor [Gemmatimonadaceae bacterium]
MRAYRAPLLTFLQWRWQLATDDAEDLVQEFWSTALHREWLERFDPERGRFRTFLRVAADRFAANEHQAARRLKRGGGTETVPLDAVALPGNDGATEAELRFRDEWIRSVFALAVERLEFEARDRDRPVHVLLFRAYDLTDDADYGRPTHDDLAREHGLSVTQVLNHLAWSRRRFRVHVLAVLRALAGSEQEYREDVRELLGVEPP